jgi:tRNA(fMet)-specific endonuclease VapC
MRYLLDSDTISFIARGEHPALLAKFMSSQPDDLAMSVISRGEAEYGLLRGATKRETELRMRALLARLRCLPLSDNVAVEYGEIRATLRRTGNPIGPNDMWIAAHARSLDLTVVTHNTREFGRIARLKVEDWLD